MSYYTDPNYRSGYELWEKSNKPEWRRSYDIPSDNSEIYYDDNEKRALPNKMLLHPSVDYFRSKPANDINGYEYLQ